VVRTVQVLAAVADHHLLEIVIPVEVHPQGVVHRVLHPDLELLPHRIACEARQTAGSHGRQACCAVGGR
jgi:hypothetical protein